MNTFILLVKNLSYRFALAILVLSLPNFGCAVRALYKEGQELQASGNSYGAAKKYIEALRKDKEHEDSKAALIAIAEIAYRDQLGIAVEFERTKDYKGAINKYQEIKGFLGEVQKRASLTFAPVNIDQKLDDLANAGAGERYAEAEAAMGQKNWEKAISEYQKALSFHSTYKDAKAKIGVAHFNWAEDDLRSRKYRSAAERYVRAIEATGGDVNGAQAKASSIYAALGRHHIGAKSCRQATSDLRTAAKFSSSPEIAADIEKAIDCSLITVSVKPFENRNNQSIGGMDLGTVLSERIASAVASGGSEFIKLIDRSALSSIQEEQSLAVAGVAEGGQFEKLKTVRYFITGTLTQVFVDGGKPSKTAQVADAEEGYECTTTTSSGQQKKSTCWQPVKVAYDLVKDKRDVKIALSMKGTDTRTGSQVFVETINSSQSDAVQYADNPRYQGNGAAISLDKLRGNAVKSLTAQVQAKRDLKSEEELGEKALSEITSNAARKILSVIDKETRAADPANLQIN